MKTRPVTTMTHASGTSAVRTAIAAALLALAALPAAAADLGAAPPAMSVKAPVLPAEEDWQYQATFYVWATGMNGKVGVRDLPPANVDITPADTLKNLNGALMGSFLAKKGDWTFLGDLIFADLGADMLLGPRGGLRASLDIQQILVQGLAGYRLPIGLPDNVALSATAGFRYQHLDADFGIASTELPIGASTGGTKDWIDPTVGLLLQYSINDKWFLNALADVGGFGVSSKITAQGFAALGYMWTPSVSSAIGYRAIYTDYTDGGFVYDVTQHGVFMSVAYHF
ncbi:outer membrane protein [Ancylobacter terrae]|uniref:outer membrane protein n=1 Tax=Ancylobacter sp. sgz301288 TaxID=3342077 RepID=UPI00385CCDCB